MIIFIGSLLFGVLCGFKLGESASRRSTAWLIAKHPKLAYEFLYATEEEAKELLQRKTLK